MLDSSQEISRYTGYFVIAYLETLAESRMESGGIISNETGFNINNKKGQTAKRFGLDLS